MPRYICRQEAGPEGTGVRIYGIREYSYTGRLVFIRCAGICAYNTRGSRDITSGQKKRKNKKIFCIAPNTRATRFWQEMALVWFRNSDIPGNLEEDLSLGRRALAVRRVEEAAITSRSPQFSKVFHCRKRSTPKVHMESSLLPRYICRQEAGPEGSGVRIHEIGIYSYTGRLVFISVCRNTRV